jgi:hypothetical protein
VFNIVVCLGVLLFFSFSFSFLACVVTWCSHLVGDSFCVMLLLHVSDLLVLGLLIFWVNMIF